MRYELLETFISYKNDKLSVFPTSVEKGEANQPDQIGWMPAELECLFCSVLLAIMMGCLL